MHIGVYVYMHRHTCMYTYIYTYAYLYTQLCTYMDAYANDVDIYLHQSASLGPAWFTAACRELPALCGLSSHLQPDRVAAHFQWEGDWAL